MHNGRWTRRRNTVTLISHSLRTYGNLHTEFHIFLSHLLTLQSIPRVLQEPTLQKIYSMGPHGETLSLKGTADESLKYIVRHSTPVTEIPNFEKEAPEEYVEYLEYVDRL